MEAGIVFAFLFWGYHVGKNIAIKILLAIAAPVVGFGFWGIVDFRNSERYAEIYRLVQELAVSGLAAILLYVSGLHVIAWLLGLISVAHHVLVYLLGERLLKNNSG